MSAFERFEASRGPTVILTIGATALLAFAWWLFQDIEAGPTESTHLAVDVEIGELPLDPARAPVAISASELRPSVLTARDDKGGLGGELCINGYRGDLVDECTYGPVDADTHIVVVGDSKAHQWLPAIERVADERGWHVTTSLKDGCPLTRAPMRDGDDSSYPECSTVNEHRLQVLLADPDVDYVFTSQRATRAYLPGEPDEVARAALVKDVAAIWAELEAAGKGVIVILDNPSPATQIPDCVAANLADLDTCAFSRVAAEAKSGAVVQRTAAELVPGVDVVDPAGWVCTDETCPAVVGVTLAYRQGSHLTATYVATLTRRFADALPM